MDSDDIDTPKTLLVGEGATGKTCLLEVFKEGKFPSEYVPTIVENFVKTIEVEGLIVPLQLWDSSGQEEYSGIRSLAYADTDVILYCYAVNDRNSFNQIRYKWLGESKCYAPKAQAFLVACKLDERKNSKYAFDDKTFVAYEEGQVLAQEIGALAFVETSAIEDINVADIFVEIAKYTIQIRGLNRKKWKFCCCT